MNTAFDWVIDTIGDTWTWLTSWNFHGVSFGAYIIGFVILSILISRIFN